MTEGRKADDGKPRFDLIPPGPLEELAKVYTFGAKKYADRNWEKGLAWGRVFAAIMRHLWAFWRGEGKDPESGNSHLAHAAFGCFALMEFEKTHPELDDRPREPEAWKEALAVRLASKSVEKMLRDHIERDRPACFIPAGSIPGQSYWPPGRLVPQPPPQPPL